LRKVIANSIFVLIISIVTLMPCSGILGLIRLDHGFAIPTQLLFYFKYSHFKGFVSSSVWDAPKMVGEMSQKVFGVSPNSKTAF